MQLTFIKPLPTLSNFDIVVTRPFNILQKVLLPHLIQFIDTWSANALPSRSNGKSNLIAKVKINASL
ncbi:hypothetical protein VCSRO99_3206 [Vibrio cholerae]|nr:hypothetical protein VCSRO99_3206 [Vibrio cholerae]